MHFFFTFFINPLSSVVTIEFFCKIHFLALVWPALITSNFLSSAAVYTLPCGHRKRRRRNHHQYRLLQRIQCANPCSKPCLTPYLFFWRHYFLPAFRGRPQQQTTQTVRLQMNDSPPIDDSFLSLSLSLNFSTPTSLYFFDAYTSSIDTLSCFPDLFYSCCGYRDPITNAFLNGYNDTCTGIYYNTIHDTTFWHYTSHTINSIDVLNHNAMIQSILRNTPTCTKPTRT